MANFWTTLKNSIKAVIKSNDAQEITGDVLQTKMVEMVDALGEYASFAGSLAPTATLPSVNKPVFYLANGAGGYGALTVGDNEIAFISNHTGSWAKYSVSTGGGTDGDDIIANLVHRSNRASEYGHGFRNMRIVEGHAGTLDDPYQIWVGSDDDPEDGGLGTTHFILDLPSPAEGVDFVYVSVGKHHDNGFFPPDTWNARETVLIINNGVIGGNAYGEVRLSSFAVSKGVKLYPGFNCISVLLKGVGSNANTYELYAHNQVLQESQQCFGEATPGTNPGVTGKYFGFYIAKTPGTYTHFKTFINNTYNPIVVSPGEYAVLYRSREHDWLKAAWTGITVDDAMSDVSTNPVQNKVITEWVSDGYVSKNVGGEYQNMESGLYTEKSLKAYISVDAPSHNLFGGGSYDSVPANESIPEGGDLEQQLDRKGFTEITSDDVRALKVYGDDGVYLDGNGEGEYLVDAPAASSNSNQIATTKWVNDKISAGGGGIDNGTFAPLDSPSFTGTPTAPTPAKTNNSTRIATTAFVQTNLEDKAEIDSPVFTGTPTAPTPDADSDDTRIATTEWVNGKISAGGGGTGGGGETDTFDGNKTITGNLNVGGALAVTGAVTAQSMTLGSSPTTSSDNMQVPTTAWCKANFEDKCVIVETGIGIVLQPNVTAVFVDSSVLDFTLNLRSVASSVNGSQVKRIRVFAKAQSVKVTRQALPIATVYKIAGEEEMVFDVYVYASEETTGIRYKILPITGVSET